MMESIFLQIILIHYKENSHSNGLMAENFAVKDNDTKLLVLR